MKDFYSFFIDKYSQEPIYKQLGDTLCGLIEKGVLTSNSRLPAIREMAKNLKVNNATVVMAYKYLENKKVVYSVVGSGTYVSPIPLENIPEPIIEKNINLIEKNFQLKSSVNFADTSLPNEFFPVDDFKNAFNELLDREKGDAFCYQGSKGYKPLRESICKLLYDYKIKTVPENIQIISGAQQGIDIISKAIMTYGDIVFTENPTFYGATGAFLSRGGKIIEIPIQNDGIDIETLENLLKLYRPKFLYVMAYFQTPTGISYSMDKKRKLIELAEKYDTYIIEDDNLYDFNYTKSNITPIKALDYKNRVIYIKSFSKILMPGLRVGFIVIPKKILNKITAAKYTTDISTSGFIQKSLDIYLRSSKWYEHIEYIKDYAMKKYKKTIEYADKYLTEIADYNKPNGGLSIWLNMKGDYNMNNFFEILINEGIIVSPGSQFITNDTENRNIRLNFSNISDENIEFGIKKIYETAKYLLN